MLSITSHQLECFIAAAETGTFNKAARRLGKSSSTVSRWIGELEDTLGYVLFDRQSNGLVVVLSKKGCLLLPKAKIAVNYLNKLENVAFALHSDSTPTDLTISFGEMVGTTGVADIVSQIKSKWSTLNITLKNVDFTHVQLALDQKDVDFALGITSDSIYTDVGGVVVGQENVVMIAHPDNPLCEKHIVNIDMLLDQTSIWSSPYEQTKKHEAALFNSLHVMDCSDVHTVVSLVKKNLGIAILPEYAAHSAIRSGELVSLNYNKQEIDETIQLVLYYRLDYPFPEVIEELINALKSWYG